MSTEAQTPPAATPDQIHDLPPEIRAWLTARAANGVLGGTSTLDQLLPGASNAAVRDALQKTGLAAYKDDNGQERFLAADLDADGNVMAVAAAIPRNTGKSVDFINEIEDFKEKLTATTTNRKDAIALFHKVYRADGTTANAIDKLAALAAPEGDFKVRSVKGQRGKAADKAAIELETALNWWKENVNSRGEEAVITGSRGITSFIRRGFRLQFIEGDHIARHVWPKKAIPIPNLKPFSLPMNLQTFSAQHIEPMEGLEGTDFELLYWVPPRQFVQQLQNPRDPNAKKFISKLVESKVLSALVRDGRYLLDPALLIHVKHRGTDVDTFGTSLIEPTLADIRYKRALDALELTVISNLMARLVILKVGSDKPESVYHRQEVTGKRLGLLQRIMRNVGPSSTILWGGPDIEVVEVSAHSALLDIVPRMQMAERRQLMSLGLPAVLMIGEGTDGKATGIAAALGVAAQLQEVQDEYAQALKSLAERISFENGYEEVDVVWEWRNNKLQDAEAAANLILKTFQMGLISTQTAAEELGYDYGAEEIRQANDVTKKYKEKPFGPPLATQGPNPLGEGGGEGGRPAKTGEKDPREGKETKSPTPNK
jgi:hypothetical protein